MNNLLTSSTNIVDGWSIDLEKGKWSNNDNVDSKCGGGEGWYGWAPGDSVDGVISTTLNASSKCGRLDFGNCWHGEGFVRAYLEGELIAEAGPDTPSVITKFQIPQDSLLEIKDEGPNSKIKVSSLEIVDCEGKILVMIRREFPNKLSHSCKY